MATAVARLWQHRRAVAAGAAAINPGKDIMKKLGTVVAVVVAVLVAAALLGPLATGGMVSAQIAKTVDNINQQGQFKASYVRAHKGWFGEQGTLELTAQNPKLQKILGTAPQAVQLDVAYGPFPFAAFGHGFTGLPVAAVIHARSDALNDLLAKSGSTFVLRSTYGLFGGNDTLARLGAGNVQTSNSKVAWQALRLDASDVVIRDGMTAGDFDLHWGGLQMDDTAKGEQIVVGKLKLEGDTHFEQGVPIGGYHLELDSAKATGMPQPMTMNGFSLKGGSTISDAQFADFDARYEIQSMQVGAQSFKPMVLAISLKHLYLPAMLQLQKAMHNPALAQEQAAGNPGAVFAAMRQPLQEMLAHQAVLQLDELRVGMPAGALTAKGKAALTAPPPPGPLNAQQLLPLLQVHLEVRAPKALAEFLAQQQAARSGAPAAQQAAAGQAMLAGLVGRGMIKPDGGDYVLVFDINKGAMQVNGSTIRQL